MLSFSAAAACLFDIQPGDIIIQLLVLGVRFGLQLFYLPLQCFEARFLLIQFGGVAFIEIGSVVELRPSSGGCAPVRR